MDTQRGPGGTCRGQPGRVAINAGHHRQSCTPEGDTTDGTSAPAPVAGVAYQPIAQITAADATEGATRQDHARQPAGFSRCHRAGFLQIGRIPREKQVSSKRATGDDTTQQPDVGTCQDLAPGHGRMLFRLGGWGRASLDVLALRFIHGPVQGRVVAEPPIEEHRPQESRNAEHDKGPAPAQPVEQELRYHGRESAADQGGRDDNALSGAA